MLQAARKKKNPRPRKETEGKPFAVPLLLIQSDPLDAGNGGDRPPFQAGCSGTSSARSVIASQRPAILFRPVRAYCFPSQPFHYKKAQGDCQVKNPSAHLHGRQQEKRGGAFRLSSLETNWFNRVSLRRYRQRLRSRLRQRLQSRPRRQRQRRRRRPLRLHLQRQESPAPQH